MADRPNEKSIQKMRVFVEKFCEKSGSYTHPDAEVTEAVVLCTVGGLIGVSLGYAVTHLAALHPKMVEVQVPFWSVALALGFSAGTGIFFGIVPAFKAAIVHPIDALRHE